MNAERFSLREMEHISVNYAITCMNGFDRSFMDYMAGIKKDWRGWLKNEDKKRIKTIK